MNYIFMAADNTILDASKNTGFGQFLQSILSYVCLLIDSVVYFLVKVAYKLFLALAQFELFNDSAFEYLINRTYIVIGVISLFIVAYSLLNAIINPDNASKGNKSVTKIVKNIVIAIIGVAVMPTIFSYFYYFQKVVLCNNFIPRLILQQVNKNDTTTLNNTAEELPELIFESFFYPNKLESTDNSNSEDDPVMSEASGIKIEESNPKSEEETDTYTLAEAYDNAKGGMSFWKAFSPFIFSQPGVRDNSIQYLIILSTIAGGYIAYVFLNLCLDMGIRAVKLGYLELIAPLAIMTTIVPGQDGVFKNWSKKTISCAVEVFTRLFVVVFAVYLVSTIKDILQPSFSSTLCGIELNFVYILLLRAIIYFSIFAFAKQAPKFFSEATGIKSDGFKIGLLDKMKENGMAQAFGAMGGGITSGIRNFAANGGDNWQNAQNAWKNKDYKNWGLSVGKGLLGGAVHPGSLVAGAASGLRRGWSNTKDIKKWSDIKEGAGKAADEAMEAKLKRDDYREKHRKNIPIIGGAVGAAAGHVGDAWDAVRDYPNSHAANYNFQNKKHQSIDEIIKAENAIDSQVKSLLESKKAKLEYTDANGTSTLLDIRNARDDADQAYNAAVDALAQAKVNGTASEIAKATTAVNDALSVRTDARKRVIDAEKQIKKDIRLGNVDDIIGYNEAGQLNQMYEKYYSALRDNSSSLSSDADALQHAKDVLNGVRNVDEFRNNVETIIRKVAGSDVSFIDDVKHVDAETLARMNQEGEAAKKQQEKK